MHMPGKMIAFPGDEDIATAANLPHLQTIPCKVTLVNPIEYEHGYRSLLPPRNFLEGIRRLSGQPLMSPEVRAKTRRFSRHIP
jgi:hypothetical protein